MIDLLFIVKQKAECLSILTKDINILLCLFVRTIHYRLFFTMQNDNIVSLCVCVVYDNAWHKDGVVTAWRGGGCI